LENARRSSSMTSGRSAAIMGENTSPDDTERLTSGSAPTPT
jgi:hypothetical protein